MCFLISYPVCVESNPPGCTTYVLADVLFLFSLDFCLTGWREEQEVRTLNLPQP